MAKKATEYKAPTADKLIKTEALILKAIGSIKTRGNNLQNDVHIAACSILALFADSKDVRIVRTFMEALPASYRTNALRDWFTAYGPVSWDKNKAVFNAKFDLSELDKSVRQALLDPFWLFSPEAVYQPLNLNAKLDQLIKALASDQTKGDHNKFAGVMSALELLKEQPAPVKPAATGDALVDALNQ